MKTRNDNRYDRYSKSTAEPATATGAPMGNAVLTTRQVAELLQVKETTLEQWRWNGKGPLFVKLGRCVRYRQTDLEAFVKGQIFTSTTAAQHGNVAVKSVPSE